ncbi:MAG: hypothetical protein ACFFCZ_12820 [Promethearchaeota archaeon]
MTRKLEFLAKKKRRAAGRKDTIKKRHKQHQRTLPLISRPESGIETPRSVNAGVEPVTPRQIRFRDANLDTQ